MEYTTAASIFLSTGLNQFLHASESQPFASLDEHLGDCAGFYFYMGEQPNRLLVSESAQAWATVLKNNGAYQAFYLLRKKDDLVLHSPEVKYLDKGKDCIVVVYPNKVEYWMYMDMEHTDEHKIKIKIKKADEGAVVPKNLPPVNFKVLKQSMAQAYAASLKFYQAKVEKSVHDDSEDYSIGVDMFKEALARLESSDLNIKLLCNQKELDVQAVQIFHSLRCIATVNRMGSFLEMYKIADEHIDLVNKIYILYQQTVNANLHTS